MHCFHRETLSYADAEVIGILSPAQDPRTQIRAYRFAPSRSPLQTVSQLCSKSQHRLSVTSMSFLGASRMSLLLFCALSAGLQSGSQFVASTSTRKLQQSNGPANIYGNAASATTADLVNDPAGRAHLLVSTASSRQHRCGTAAILLPELLRDRCCRHNNRLRIRVAGAPRQPCGVHRIVSSLRWSRPVQRRPLCGSSGADTYQWR